MGKYAVILVSALIFGMITYSHGLLNTFLSSSQRTADSYSYNQAQNIAQSALMIAMSDIKSNQNSSFIPDTDSIIAYPSSQTYQEWPDLNGFYRLLFQNHGDTLLAVQAIGRFEDKDSRASAGLVFSGSNHYNWPFINQAAHAEGNITLTGSSRLIGDASTNSTNANAVSFGWSTYIDGNLSVGPGGDPDVVAPKISPWAPDNVRGERGALSEKLEFEMPKFPDFPNSIPTGNSFRVTTWEEDQAQNEFHFTEFHGYRLEELAIAGNRTMTLNVGSQDRILHVGSIDISQGHLNIVGDGNLTIYVEDEFGLGGGSTFNGSGDPEKLIINYKGQDAIDFGGNTTLHANIFINEADFFIAGSNSIRGNIITGGENVTITGNAGNNTRVLFAPNADVVLSGSGRVYGSVIGKTFSAIGNTFVEYQPDLDVELPELESTESSSASYSITYWN